MELHPGPFPGVGDVLKRAGNGGAPRNDVIMRVEPSRQVLLSFFTSRRMRYFSRWAEL